MKNVLIAVFLFGLLHPGSKYIFSTGLDIYFFSFYYIFIRTIIGVPLAFRFGTKKIQTNDFLIFISLGIIGALVQVSEFIAVFEGIPVSTVSFLIFTLPLWSTILGRLINNEPINAMGISKITVVFLGTLLIFWNAIDLNFKISMLIWPIFSGFLLSLWVCISKRIREKGYSSITINATYDFLSLICLFIFLVFKVNTTQVIHNLHWLGSFQNLITIVLYSLFLGFLANILIYHASKTISAVQIGIAMSLEPIIATLISIFLFDDKLTYGFLTGSLLILIANIPEKILYSLKDTLLNKDQHSTSEKNI